MTCILGDNEWCTPRSRCFACSEAWHRAEHPEAVEECLTCRLRSVQLAPSCTPSKPRKLQTWGAKGGNNWERGLATDSRGMPLLKANGAPIGLKEYGERRGVIESARRQLANT